MKRIGLISLLGLAVILLGSGSRAENNINTDPFRHLSHHHDCDQEKGSSVSKPVYTCPMHSEVVQDKPGKCPKCGMNLAQKDQYTCPMHSDVIRDKPGKCPECGMNLVKKEIAKDQYTCPMHSDVLSEKAGKCPKCGMNLVLKTTDKKNTAVKK